MKMRLYSPRIIKTNCFQNTSQDNNQRVGHTFGGIYDADFKLSKCGQGANGR